MSKDVINWIQENRKQSILLENSKDGSDSMMSKLSDETIGSGETLESKMDDTSSSKSSEDEKKLQKQKKDLLHRDIEKRRRDRINNSLSELRDLIPSAKTKLKCDGNTRSGRLQKAKLLELTVEYLRSVKVETATDSGYSTVSETSKTLPSSKTDSTNGDPLVVESAKQIYVTGYKAGFNHALNQIKGKIKTDELNEMPTSIDLKLINIPAMFLVSDTDSKSDKGDSDSGRGSRNSAVVDGVHVTPSVTSVDRSVITFNNSSSVVNRTRTSSPCFEFPPKLTKMNSSSNSNSESMPLGLPQNKTLTESINNEKSIDAQLFSERSPVLISSYILNESQNRYYPTVLPLEVLLKASQESQKSVISSSSNNLYGYNENNNNNNTTVLNGSSSMKRILKQESYRDMLPNPKKPHIMDDITFDRERELQSRYEWLQNMEYLRRNSVEGYR